MFNNGNSRETTKLIGLKAWIVKDKGIMTTYHLYKWSVTYPHHYLAPEAQSACLSGYRDDEPTFVRTSSIISVNGREIKTHNSLYILEDIDEGYLKWMKENGYSYNYDNPITLKQRR